MIEYIGDGGGELLATELATAHDQPFVELERAHLAEAAGLVDQGLAVADEGGVDGVPVTAELGCRVTADLCGEPASGPIGHGHTRSGDAPVVLGPAAFSQSASGQHQRRLYQMRRVGRPNEGRSISATSGRSFTEANDPQVGQPTRTNLVSTRICSGRPGCSSMPSTFTSGKPTSSSHMRVGSVSTGAGRVA